MALFTTEDGSHSLYSEKYGVSYHSKYGAITETQVVFIDAALNFKAKQSSNLSVLEIGMGTGLNVLMSFIEAEKSKLTLQYTAIEGFPVSNEQLSELNFCKALGNNFQDTLDKIHSLDWNKRHDLSPTFRFEKQLKLFEEINFNNEFDIVYFDAFAPTSQPELWEESFLRKMYLALKPNGVLTTYCAKGVVKRTLKKIGFEIEALPGPPGKREMTRALKSSH